MTSRAEDLLREALTLPDDERADLAAELLASLGESPEDPAVVLAAWTAEIERRARRVQASESPGEDWLAVRQRLGAHLQH
jgi:hypothetical protein